jgi:hypothetical protein
MLTHLHVLSRNTKIVVLVCRVSINIQIYAGLPSAWTVGRTSFTFGIQKCIGHRSVPGEYEHPGSKNREPLDGPHNKMGIFLKLVLTIQVNFQ